MNPAFSVIFFTTLSGLGYGLWFWACVGLMQGQGEQSGTMSFVALALGFVFVSIGLLSSTLHLGKPLRAWRAFSQWRTSWLSREAVLAIGGFVPFVGLIAFALFQPPIPMWIASALLLALMLLSLATIVCTAMIYASLKTIPAWSHRLVVPGYLLFALATGGLLHLTLLSIPGLMAPTAGVAIAVASLLLGGLKLAYWRDIDRGEMPVDRASALGLPANRVVRDFERPHTEANYLTREMGFVVARKHARKLRLIAMMLFAALPALVGLLVAVAPSESASLLWLATPAALLGAMVERWLFFAEAKHVVMTYY
ncbi:dimethyl sulfoxide reductase anchor subunit family protein [Arenimonas sp.]|uniref:dimethyl sulfoxide reductase anchor subunit family protein n=1 Tax=Arenimonas sp. TaxID=1872635 RepID=UPI0039E2EF24